MERINEARSLGAVRDGLVICGEPLGAHLWFAPLDRSAIGSSAQPQLAALPSFSANRCGRFAVEPGVPGAARATISNGHSALIGPDGAQIDASLGRTLAWTGPDGPREVLLVDPSSGAFVSQYGDPALDRGPIVALINGEDRTLVFHASGEVELHREGAIELAELAGLPPRASVTAAALDPSSATLLVAIAGGRRSWLARAPLASLVLEEIAGVDLQMRSIQRIANVAIDRSVLIDEREILILEGDRLQTAEMIFDDPSTAAIEPAVTELELADLTAAPGRAWAVGTPALLFEINAFSFLPVAQRIELDRASQGAFAADTMAVSAAHAICPDDLLLSARADPAVEGGTGLRYTRGVTWELASTDRIEACGTPYLDRCLLDVDRAASSSDLVSGEPAALAGDRAAPDAKELAICIDRYRDALVAQ